MKALPTRPLILTLLALVLVLPTPAQRGGKGDGTDEGGKAGKLFGGARLRLAPLRSRSKIDIREVMRKVKELQVKAKAQQQNRSERAVQLADEAQLRDWFKICDHNRNGWISYSEAAYSLRFSRGRFQVFDTDRDGRLVPAEFQEFYMNSILSSGSFTKPRAKRGAGPPPSRSPEQLRAAYDRDLDGALSEIELSQLLLDYEQATADPDSLLEALDVNGDLELSLDELPGLHAILYPEVAPEIPQVADKAPPSILELFGEVVPRPSEGNSPPQPPQIGGPVPPFARLDIDRDGYISASDLETLLRPIHLGLRPRALLNTLDTDGDLRLSEEEFDRALGLGPQSSEH